MYTLITLILFVAAIVLWLRWRAKHFNIFKDLGIPGPEPSLLFGNMLEMYRRDPIVCQNEWIEKYGDVVGYFFGSYPCLLVTRPELLKQVFIKDFSSFSDRPTNIFATDLDNENEPSSQHMVNLKGKRWKEVRNLLTPTFTTGKLKQMLSLLKDSVSLAMCKLDDLSKNGTEDINIYCVYKGMTMDAIGRTAFGIEVPVQDNPNHPLIKSAELMLSVQLQSLVYVVMVCFREFRFLTLPVLKLVTTINNKGKNPLKELFAISGDVIAKRRANPSSRRPDLLQTIIDARALDDEISEKSLIASSGDEPKDNTKECVSNGNIGKEILEKKVLKLTDTEIQANAFLYFLAGYETTSTSLAFLTHHLLNNPHVQDKMREEIVNIFGTDDAMDYEDLHKMQYTDRCIMEALRMHPPIYLFLNREANRTVQLGEWTIPQGLNIQAPVHNLHYNPKFFPDPHVFNPDRFLPENRSKDHSVTFLPFGTGPRNCIGMRFALLEMKMALVKMLKKYKLVPCGKTEMGNLKLEFSLGVNRPQGIYLRAVPL